MKWGSIFSFARLRFIYQKPLRNVLGFGFVLGVVLVLWSQIRGKQPSYEGKTLTEWLLHLARRDDPQAGDAIRAMGRNALPTLLHWMQYEPEPWRESLVNISSRLPRWVGKNLTEIALEDSAHFRRDLTPYAFSALGSSAAPALPTLVGFLNAPEKSFASSIAVEALGAIGQEGLDPLLSALARTNFPFRYLVVTRFPAMQSAGVDVSAAMPAVFACLQDTDCGVRAAAARALGSLGLAENLAVPALIDVLKTNTTRWVRVASINALTTFCEGGRRALPALCEALHDSDQRVRDAATDAIRTLAPELVGVVVPDWPPPWQVLGLPPPDPEEDPMSLSEALEILKAQGFDFFAAK